MTASAPADAGRRRRPTARTQRIAFHALVIGGAVIALLLGFREVYDRPVLRVGAERVGRDGLVSTVQVTIENTSDSRAYCPEVHVAARDREGLDLEDAVAEPDDGEGRLEPGDRMNYVGRLENLTAEDYDEELEEITAYVFAERPC